jgi:hypothetical protein
MGEATLKKALRRARLELGDDHAETLEHMDTYAEYLRKMGCYGEAEPLYRKALSARRRTLGDEHPDTLASINNLALLCRTRGSWARPSRCAAKPCLRRGALWGSNTLPPLASTTTWRSCW